MTRIVVFVVALAVVAGAHAQEFRRAQNSLDDVFQASCRVSVNGARGSGTFNGVYDGKAYISTNYHVVGSNKTATVDFWSNGVKQSVNGVVAWKAYDPNLPADFAFITVDAQELKKIDPPFVALGGSDAKPSENSFFLSSGGPKGWAVKAWKGKIVDSYGSTALFQPHPVPGQSGSGVFENVDGELFQVGIITWLVGTEGDDAAKGGAIPVANLYRALSGKRDVNDSQSIPPNAKECLEVGEYGVRVLLFTADDCPACNAVAPVVKKAAARAPLEVVDANARRELADRYGVEVVPTAVVVDASGNELDRVNYEQMTEESLVDAYLGARSDFRSRPAHYERADSGFFDDSESRWKSRGKEEECPPSGCPLPKNPMQGTLDDKLEALRDGVAKSVDRAARRAAAYAFLAVVASYVACAALRAGASKLWDFFGAFRAFCKEKKNEP